MTKRKTYYIVDDDADDQQFLIAGLTETDPTAHYLISSNGVDAIEKLKVIQPLPDAIFLDLNMPGMNGKECLSELKRTGSLKNIPVIIYSTTSDQNEIELTMRMGASFFITKMSSFKELCDELYSITAVLNKFQAYST